MYPVLSVLRRVAVHHIYVTREMLMEGEGPARLLLETESPVLDLKKPAWTHPTNVVEIQELKVTAASSVEAAIALAKRENQIAEALQVQDTVFTVVLGPESEVELDGQVVRCSRIAAIRGVYRATARTLAPMEAKNTLTHRYSKRRRETVKL